jgi:hypothetical protein
MKAKAILGVIIAIALVSTIGVAPILLQQRAYAWINPEIDPVRKAPIATDGNNIYIVWFNDKGTPNKNGEVMFRASTDNGATFSDKINLSNSTNADSVDANIAASGNRVFVTWWERNATSNQPVLKISTDNGKTFGPVLRLSANGTIGG